MSSNELWNIFCNSFDSSLLKEINPNARTYIYELLTKTKYSGVYRVLYNYFFPRKIIYNNISNITLLTEYKNSSKHVYLLFLSDITGIDYSVYIKHKPELFYNFISSTCYYNSKLIDVIIETPFEPHSTEINYVNKLVVKLQNVRLFYNTNLITSDMLLVILYQVLKVIIYDYESFTQLYTKDLFSETINHLSKYKDYTVITDKIQLRKYLYKSMSDALNLTSISFRTPLVFRNALTTLLLENINKLDYSLLLWDNIYNYLSEKNISMLKNIYTIVIEFITNIMVFYNISILFFKHNAINFNGAIEPHNIIILSRPEYYNNYHSFLTKVGFILTTKIF